MWNYRARITQRQHIIMATYTWNPNNYIFSLFCQTENKTVRGSITASSEPDPTTITTCPNGASHTILAGTVVLDHVLPQGTYERFEMPKDDLVRQNFVQTIDINTTSDMTTNAVQKSWNYPVLITAVSFVGLDEFQGDQITLDYDPDRAMGNPTADVAIGATVINVSPVASVYLRVGNYITLNDGTNRFDMGRIISVNTVANTITCENASAYAYTAATTMILRTFRLACITFLIPSEFPFTREFVGGGRYVNPGIVFRITHNNITGGAKRAQAMLNMLI